MPIPTEETTQTANIVSTRTPNKGTGDDKQKSFDGKPYYYLDPATQHVRINPNQMTVRALEGHISDHEAESYLNSGYTVRIRGRFGTRVYIPQ